MKTLLTTLALAAGLTATAQTANTHELVINTKKVGAEIQPTMYGLFFEDINYAADGGLYAELVKNRSFEFPCNNLQGWKVAGKVELKNDGPFERNPHYVRLNGSGHGHKHTCIENEGFFGIGVEKGKKYRFSVWARTAKPTGTAKIYAEIANTKSMGENQGLVKFMVNTIFCVLI